MSMLPDNNPIYLYDDEESLHLNGALPLVCTNNFFTKCSDFDIDSERFLNKLVNQKVFLITHAPKNKEYFHILTDEAILICVAENRDSFKIVSLQEKTIGKQNHFIRSSLKLRTDLGAVIWYGSNDIWGRSVRPTEAQSTFRAIHNVFLEKLEALKTDFIGEDEEAEVDYSVSDELENLLSVAEYYAIAEDEIQKAKAQSGPRMSYYQFQAAEGFDRVEKLAYHFLLSEIDQNVYKKGTRVVIHLKDGTEASGVITELMVDEEPYEIVVLFDELFQVDDLLPAGIISLEYNAVQLEVRKQVIEDIRNGTTPAKYIDNVIGQNKFAGFTKKDLTSLMDRLKKSKYPPNESQLDAIARGIETNDVLLVLGPPGTGKTTVILEWVKFFVLHEKKRVLISSQNNKAVDNVLERLAEEKEIDTIRVGSEEKIQANVQHLMYEERAYELQKTIIEANEKYTEKISREHEKLTHFINQLTTLAPLAGKVESAYKTLTNSYEEMHERFIKPLFALLETDKLHKKELHELKDQIVHLKNKHASLEGAPIWKKPITFFQSIYYKSKIGKLTEKHQKLAEENKIVVFQYNPLMRQLKNYRKGILEPNKERWNALSEEWDQACEPMEDVEVTDINGEQFTYTLSAVVKESAETDLDMLLKNCGRLNYKFNIISSSLERWRGFLEEKKNHALSKILLESVDLVGATCIGINSQKRFQDLDFDVTIIDEAGQIQIQNAIVPMSRSPKLIMLGDHLQIPPVVDDEVKQRCQEAGVDTSFLPKSLFEHLYGKFRDENKILLNTQYRMPAEIADLLSEWFYDGKYHSFEGKRNMKPALPHLFTHPFVLLNTADHPNRLETQKKDEGCFNQFEAELVIEILKEILIEANDENSGKSGLFSIADVGVISPYRLQVKHIRDMVLEAFPHLTKLQVNDLVASLDSFQGQERKVIIYSCTRSNDKSPKQARIGFLKELRRLNVALSRCQQQLIFIGDLPFLSSCEYEQLDEDGYPLVDEFGKPLPGTSEKEFSEFIQLMERYALDGKAQLLSTKAFLDLMKKAAI